MSDSRFGPAAIPIAADLGEQEAGQDGATVEQAGPEYGTADDFDVETAGRDTDGTPVGSADADADAAPDQAE